MYLNDFSARIPEGVETPGGYVEMQHGKQYTLVLRNGRTVQCDAYVEIDGKHVGTWRLNPWQTISLQRPAHDTGRFTFYELGTIEAQQAQLNGGSPDLGLVKVTFTPERVWQQWQDATPKGFPMAAAASGLEGLESTVSYRGGGTTSASANYTAGGTGLSGQSRQQFIDVGEIEKDYSQQTVIHLRLVARNSSIPRPLTSFSTPVPPRIL